MINETQQLHSKMALVQDALEKIKAEDVLIIDMREKWSLSDEMIIASVTAFRQAKGFVRHLRESKHLVEGGLPVFQIEASPDSDWMLVDLGDIIIHVMSPEARCYYDLERLWAI